MSHHPIEPPARTPARPSFTALASVDRTAVELTLFGKRGSLIATVTFSPAEARELRRQLGVALYQLRPVGGAS